MSMKTMMNQKSKFNKDFSSWLKAAMKRVELINTAHLDSQTTSDYYAILGDYHSKRVFTYKPAQYDTLHRVERLIKYYEINKFQYFIKEN